MNSLNIEWIKRPAVFGTILGVIVLAAIWWLAWMSPQATKLSSINTQQTTAQNTISVLDAEIVQLKSQSSQLTKELPYLKFFQGQIPALPLQGQLTSQLYNLSLQTKTFMSSLSDSDLSPPTATSGGYSTMPITIQLTGSRNGVFTFLKGLYTLARLVTIQQVSLTPPTQTPNLNSNSAATAFSASITATAYTTYVPAPPTTTTIPPTTTTSSG